MSSARISRAFLCDVPRGIMSVLMSARVYALQTPTYDLGIFSQIFHQMKTDGTQVTTLERSYPLSHFAVHVSPILYLLLPFYALIPRPETLQVLQILVVASGFIPLDLLMRKHKFQPWHRVLFAVLYFLLPALNGSSLFDFHENCFLAPILLWLFYALERRHLVGTVVSSILLLAVKEDVVIYFAFIGVWQLLNKRWKTGLALIVIPAIVFAIEIRLLSLHGDGTLAASRFPNVSAFPDLGLIGIVPTFLLSPAYFLAQVFTEEKWLYILQMLLPLGFTPLLQRKSPSRLVLLFPFIIMNLISSYPYLHKINFQYNYGNGVILLYLSLLFWSDLIQAEAGEAEKAKRRSKQFRQENLVYLQYSLAVISIFSSLYICLNLWGQRADSVEYIRSHREELKAVHSILDEIPQEAAVRANTFLTTALSNRSVVYDIGYENGEDAVKDLGDYYISDLRYALKDGQAEKIEALKAAGWLVEHEIENWILVLRKAD